MVGGSALARGSCTVASICTCRDNEGADPTVAPGTAPEEEVPLESLGLAEPWSFDDDIVAHGLTNTLKEIKPHVNSSTTQASTRGIAANNDTAMQRG